LKLNTSVIKSLPQSTIGQVMRHEADLTTPRRPSFVAGLRVGLALSLLFWTALLIGAVLLLAS
jgi:hypothetical protein